MPRIFLSQSNALDDKALLLLEPRSAGPDGCGARATLRRAPYNGGGVKLCFHAVEWEPKGVKRESVGLKGGVRTTGYRLLSYVSWAIEKGGRIRPGRVR